MKIVIDAMGGDNAPLEVVKGVAAALNEYKDLKIVLTGNKQQINESFKSVNFSNQNVEVVDCQTVITNDDVPTEAFKTKQDSSLVKAFDILKTDSEVCGLISAGSTGAILTGAFLKIGRIRGVSRPALCPILPTLNGKKVMLIDAGANVDCKPINLCHFALMASTYMQNVEGVENPRVALLSIGTEDKKGNEFTHECFKELKKLPINFVGNMESRDFMSGNYDVVVADGFYGNIMLKSVEGTGVFILSNLKNAISSSIRGKIGALFLKKALKNLKGMLNYNNYGGSIFLGVKKIVVKSHGSSDQLAFYRSIQQVVNVSNNNICGIIEQQVAKVVENG